MYDYLQLQKEISENCGWSGENYKCYCEKGKAMEIQSIIDERMGKEINLSELNIIGVNND